MEGWGDEGGMEAWREVRGNGEWGTGDGGRAGWLGMGIWLGFGVWVVSGIVIGINTVAALHICI